MAPFALLACTRWDPLLTNLKWNNDLNNTPSPFLLLHYHLDRLLVAARLHNWETAAKALSYESIRSECLRAVQEYPRDEGEPPAAFKACNSITRQLRLLTLESDPSSSVGDRCTHSSCITCQTLHIGSNLSIFLQTRYRLSLPIRHPAQNTYRFTVYPNFRIHEHQNY